MVMQDFKNIDTSGRRRNHRTGRSIFGKLAEITIGGLFGLFFAYLAVYIGVNWIMGCGEVFYTADGGTIAGECSPFWPWDFFGGAW